MDLILAAALAVLAGLVLGALAAWALCRRPAAPSGVADRAGTDPGEPALPPGTLEVLGVLDSVTMVLDPTDAVVQTSPAAQALGLVRGEQVVHRRLLDLVRQVRADREIRQVELEVPRGPLGGGRLVVGVRAAPLGPRHVLLLVSDRTEARRVEEVRRDFVVNVSHELKTPVGAISLLAEAITESAGDAEAVLRFAGRMQAESERLTALVREIIELSRLQVSEGLVSPELVDVDEVVGEAVDRSRLVADARGVRLATGGDRGARVHGDRDLLVTAVRNLVDNAVRYSDAGTKVGIGVREHDGLVEVAVTDQGIGIAAEDQHRVFERFYRIDAARSRATGGTGLGLSIVKHVASNHGGDVVVWSQPGQGSTFTLRLPDADAGAAPPAPAAQPTAGTTGTTTSTTTSAARSPVPARTGTRAGG